MEKFLIWYQEFCECNYWVNYFYINKEERKKWIFYFKSK